MVALKVAKRAGKMAPKRVERTAVKTVDQKVKCWVEKKV